MNWLLILNYAFLGLVMLISVGNLVYVLTFGRQKCKQQVQEFDEFIAYLDNLLLVLKSDADEETKHAMLLYVHEQWVEAHPESTRERK